MVSWMDQDYMGNGVEWMDQDYMGNGVRWVDQDYMGNGFCDNFKGGIPSEKWQKCAKTYRPTLKKRYPDINKQRSGKLVSRHCKQYTMGVKKRKTSTQATNLRRRVMKYMHKNDVTLQEAWDHFR